MQLVLRTTDFDASFVRAERSISDVCPETGGVEHATNLPSLGLRPQRVRDLPKISTEVELGLETRSSMVTFRLWFPFKVEKRR